MEPEAEFKVSSIKTKATIGRLLAVIFVLAAAVPFFGNYALHGSTPGKVLKTENRTVAAYKELKSLKNGDLKDYYHNLDRFISDHLADKDGVVDGINRFFGDPAWFFTMDLDKGMMGEDGFAFLGNAYGHIVDRHFSRNFTLKPDLAFKFLTMQTAFKHAAENSGAAYMVMVPPDKHAVYCDFIPAWLKSENSCQDSDRITREMSKILGDHGIPVAYPLENLRAPTSGRNYFKTDTHWNLKGASVGFEVLMRDLAARFPKFSSLKTQLPELVETENHTQGDLKVFMGFPPDFKVDDVTYALTDDPLVEFSESHGEFKTTPLSEVLIQGQYLDWTGRTLYSEAPNNLKVLVICDSFMIAMSRFMTLNFSDVSYVSRHADDQDLLNLVSGQKWDLVIYENVEHDFPLP